MADLTVTVSADVEILDLQRSLEEVGQWAAIDGGGRSSIGRLIEIDSTGPMRLGFGGWRDLLLGLQFRNGRGELITVGGRTVKNVAGYDLTKLMVGSCRVFGEIVTATMRTYKRPTGEVTARFMSDPDPAIVAPLLATALRPQSVMLGKDRLLLRYLGDAATLEYVRNALPTLGPEQILADGFNDLSPWPVPDSGVLLRVALPPTKVKGWVATLGEHRWDADPVFGIIAIALPTTSEIESLASSAEAAGGTVRVFTDLETTPRLVRVSTNPGEQQIIRQLKQAFDPDNRLQPLPF